MKFFNTHDEVYVLFRATHISLCNFVSTSYVNPGGARFSALTDRPRGPPSLLYKWYRVSPGGKVRPGRAADHSPPSSSAVIEE